MSIHCPAERQATAVCQSLPPSDRDPNLTVIAVLYWWRGLLAGFVMAGQLTFAEGSRARDRAGRSLTTRPSHDAIVLPDAASASRGRRRLADRRAGSCQHTVAWCFHLHFITVGLFITKRLARLLGGAVAVLIVLVVSWPSPGGGSGPTSWPAVERSSFT